MWNKVTQMSIALYLSLITSAKQIKDDFMDDERGLSGVVVAVLLILVAVLAIVMIWGFLSGWLSDMWDNITGKANEIQ